MAHPVSERRRPTQGPLEDGHLPFPDGPVFARHETFAPRFGWLKKGFEAATADPGIFLSDDAPVRLGVGKNMARAIRYWCHAFKVLADSPIPGQRSFNSVPTKLGRALLSERGWDPYLEDAASLWYLHWKLLETPSQATAWRFAFTTFSEREFTVEQLDHAMQAFVAEKYPGARAAPSSIHKDVLCVVRMYTEVSTSSAVTEENIQCPFAELGLLRRGAEPKVLAFEVGEKPSLPDAVIVAACAEFSATAAPGGRTVALSRLLSDHGSPGMAFKLTESALVAAVERTAAASGQLGLADTAGLVQVSFSKDPAQLAQDLLRGHFHTSHSRAAN